MVDGIKWELVIPIPEKVEFWVVLTNYKIKLLTEGRVV